MTFAAIETSPDSGSPIELYLFEIGGERFAYNNTEQDVTVAAILYEASPVKRSRITLSSDAVNSRVTVELPGDNLFSRLYIGVIPGELPQVTISQYHETDPDEEIFLIFDGFVSTVGFSNNLRQADIICSPITAATGKFVPRHTFQSLCNHSLYDDFCTQQETDFEETVTVDSISDRLMTLSGLSTTAAGYWEGGFIQIGTEYRQIMTQASNVMTLDLPFLENPVGMPARALPGCDHVIDGDCQNTFGTGPAGNSLNHGGFPYVPSKNPFEGLD